MLGSMQDRDCRVTALDKITDRDLLMVRHKMYFALDPPRPWVPVMLQGVLEGLGAWSRDKYRSWGGGEVTAPGVGLSLHCINLQHGLCCTAAMGRFWARPQGTVWF